MSPGLFPIRRCRQAPRRAPHRGFTLIEMLAVVAFIGILAAAATPTWVETARDRRVEHAATRIADLYRVARTRAMGRGSAMLVAWDAAAVAPAMHFTVREAILGVGAGATLPATSCFTDWTADVTSKFVASFDERSSLYAPAQATFLDQDGIARTDAQICFTPRGRTFVRFAKTGAFTVLTGVPRVQVTNSASKLARFVVVPPHGSTRVVGEL